MNHNFYMQQALDLAEKGWPEVRPNPMVGCVIVYKDQVVAEGYHEHYGQAHAEVEAVKNLPSTIPAEECLVYVTLEPCSHFGKTPPCADLLIKKGFKNVVVACTDPNPLVSGRGIQKLRDAGVKVQVGVLEQEALALNRRFVTFYKKNRPYIILKWAITKDGFISQLPIPANRQDNVITRLKAQEMVHQLRSEVMAILVGKNTALTDNPGLTTRLVSGKNPIRLVIDKNLEIPQTYQVYNEQAETIVFNDLKTEQNGHIRLIKLNFKAPLLIQLLQQLKQLNIQSLLVEGGATTLRYFIEEDCWDEALIFQNPQLLFKEGIKGPEFALKNSFECVGDDILFHHYKDEVFGVD